MVFLIGGPSHAGKTTLARALADRLGWALQSTDHLGRHPGRPWGGVPARVADHYLTLTTGELMAAYEAHYARMWPLLKRLITRHATDPSAEALVLEGSGIRPPATSSLVESPTRCRLPPPTTRRPTSCNGLFWRSIAPLVGTTRRRCERWTRTQSSGLATPRH